LRRPPPTLAAIMLAVLAWHAAPAQAQQGLDGRLRHAAPEGLRWGATLPEREAPRVTLPYLGLGYTSIWLRDGISLSADIGLGGLRPGERLRLGSGGAQVERVLDGLRLASVLQLGLGYAF
jgi:hypothetical protein